ncbi:MAG: hypothetical protein WC359_12935 [Dehalococcoidia bacterium]
MKIKELLDIVNSGYPDNGLSEYYDDQGKPKKGHGDGLAQFVVIEICETLEEDGENDDQLWEARRVMTAAIEELHGVCEVLRKEERRIHAQRKD